MKRLTLLTMLVTLLSVTAFAQKGMKMRPLEPSNQYPVKTMQCSDFQSIPASNLTKRAPGEELVTPPAGLATEDYTFTATYKNSSSASKTTRTIKIGFSGSDVYIQGISYYLEDAWIKGTLNAEKTAISIPSPQYYGSISQGGTDYPVYFIYNRYVNDNDDTYPTELVLPYDAATGAITVEKETYIEEGNQFVNAWSCYGYYYNISITKGIPEEPKAVVLPDGVTAEEYVMTYQDEKGESFSKPTKVAVNGNDVYVQGFSKYLPEAWVKGTKNGNLVTFPKMQYMGEYGTYGSSYAFYSGDAVFTYDAETEAYSAEGLIFGVLADQYYDGKYVNPVLGKIIEKAGTPADPIISSVGDTQYGPAMEFNIPLVDVDGNNMVTSKLSYQVFVDVEQEVSPLTFKASDYKYLEQDMTIIPYGFTENYDFYADQIYLNMPEYKTFNKIGIQSIYTGGGEEHKSEITWFTIKEYGYVEPTPVEVPEGLVTEPYIFSAMETVATEAPARRAQSSYSYQTKVGFDGDDVYIKGLSENTADMWIKATKNEAGKYVIPANQYMGQLDLYGMFTFDYYLAACDEQLNAVDIVLDFDAENSKFTTDQIVVINGSLTEWDPYQTFTEVSLTKFIEVAATPADPTVEGLKFNATYPSASFTVPAVGTNGETLNVEKLFYTIWVEKDGKQQPYTFTAAAYKEDFDEDVTEVPYTHSGWDFYSGAERVYFEEAVEELETWSRVGIQTIYYGAGEVHKSNIAWGFNETFIPTEIVVTQEGYATFYDANHSFVIPEGIKAYVVTAATTDKLTYSELEGIIPAGTAVLLEAKSAGTYPVVVSTETVAYDGINLLHGSNLPTMTTADTEDCLFYKLAYGHSAGVNANTVGWYWGAENGAAFQIEPHRAWLAIPQIVSAPGYPFGGDVTGISTVVAAESADGNFYDLQGRRVSTPVKGLYINKNKIVIFK
jgi:hypothetical protein